jgi:hypothetical protein
MVFADVSSIVFTLWRVAARLRRTLSFGELCIDDARIAVLGHKMVRMSERVLCEAVARPRADGRKSTCHSRVFEAMKSLDNSHGVDRPARGLGDWAQRVICRHPPFETNNRKRFLIADRRLVSPLCFDRKSPNAWNRRSGESPPASFQLPGSANDSACISA